jgi:tRNA threonylcarbamoyladenosine biosynthesis protein TsaE
MRPAVQRIEDSLGVDIVSRSLEHLVILETRHFHWASEADCERFAQDLARQPGLSDACIELHGSLGAGKTSLVRHLLRALGVQGRIKSPTYAVVEPHEGRDFPIWHFDFYRFDDPREWEDAGFRDIFASPGLKVAEWPQKAAAVTPIADVAISIEAINESERQVHLQAYTPAGASIVQGFSA